MTESTKTTNQSQSSSTQPWEAAMPLVNKLISQYGSQNPSVTSGQSQALENLNSATSSLPNFTPQATSAVNSLFSSNNAPQVGMLQSAYNTQQANLSPLANPANLNPYNTPGLSDALKTMTSDITNQVKGVYGGSGRDPSGAGSFAGSLSRGLTQGLAPTLVGQYNTNVGNLMPANNAMLGGAGSTASGISGLNQTDLQNRLSGIMAGSAIPGLATSPATAQLLAANTSYGQPYQNLSALLQPSIALAGLGSQGSGNMTGTQVSNPSLMSSIGQGFQLGSQGLGALGSLFALSDKDLKTDIVPVGKLNDGQKVYSYRFKGDPKRQIGLIAQEVAMHEPEAVARHPSGYLMVDYGRATRRAAAVGHLAEAA